jgi:archaellum biogenesis ATPase FlaH
MTDHHANQSAVISAAYDYINNRNWTILLVGDDKRPLGPWSKGSWNRFDYTNSERLFDHADAKGIGVICGASSIVIIDLDNADAIQDYAQRYGVPTTRLVRTPRGRHIYFNAPRGIPLRPQTSILDGVDLRAGESYAVLPPSQLAGGEYEWIIDTHNEELSDELVTLLRDEANNEPAYKKALTQKIPEGERHSYLVSLAGSLRRVGMTEAGILAALRAQNTTALDPPEDDEELRRIANSLAQKEPDQLGHLTGFDLELIEYETTKPDEAPSYLRNTLRAYDLNTLITTKPDPIPWVWETYIAGGTLNILHGAGGLGKSYLTLKLAEAIVSNNTIELANKQVATGSVIIIDGENSKHETHRRIQHTRLDGTEPLYIYDAPLPILGHSDATIQLVNELQAEHEPRLIIIDSLRALWHGDEREQGEAGRMLRELARHIENYPDTAILIIHHDNKGGDYSGSTDINAAITGSRLHLSRADKLNPDEYPQARVLTHGKNRVAQESSPYTFSLIISDEHPPGISGINITEISKKADTYILATKLRDKYAGQEISIDEALEHINLERKSEEWRQVREQLYSMQWTLCKRSKDGRIGVGSSNITFAPKAFYEE